MNELKLKENDERLLSLETLLNKDIWHTVNDLGLKLLEHRRQHIFNFQQIHPIWLNLLAKLYVLTKHKIIACRTLNAHIYTLKKFADFLSISNSIYNPNQINNQTFEELGMLRQMQGLSIDYENLNRCIKGLEESSNGD